MTGKEPKKSDAPKKSKPGPEADRLVVDMSFDEAAKKFITKPKPKADRPDQDEGDKS